MGVGINGVRKNRVRWEVKKTTIYTVLSSYMCMSPRSINCRLQDVRAVMSNDF